MSKGEIKMTMAELLLFLVRLLAGTGVFLVGVHPVSYTHLTLPTIVGV